MSNLKGQAAIEYLSVFGIALLLSTPFIIKAQSSILELKTSSGVIELQNSLDNTERSIKMVSAAGEPARMKFDFKVPENVESAQIENKSLIYTIRTRGGRSQLIRSFETNISGNLPENAGRHKLIVRAEDGKAIIEVVK